MLPVVLTAVFGVLSWSLLEYLLHRFLGHDRRTMPNFFSGEHTRHHSQGEYFAPAWKKALATLAASIALLPLALLALGSTGAVYVSAFIGMYVTYEWVHRRAHTHEGIGAYGRFLRRHHFHHHFANPRANHGVTSPLWDLVFGTYESPAVIRVPEKLAMRWLVDGATGHVHAKFAAAYALTSRVR